MSAIINGVYVTNDRGNEALTAVSLEVSEFLLPLNHAGVIPDHLLQLVRAIDARTIEMDVRSYGFMGGDNVPDLVTNLTEIATRAGASVLQIFVPSFPQFVLLRDHCKPCRFDKGPPPPPLGGGPGQEVY